MNNWSLHRWWRYLLSVHDFSPSCLDMIHFSRCSPPPDFKHSSIWPSLRSAKNVKKQQEVSDLNQDYVSSWSFFRSYYRWLKWCIRSRSEVKGQGHRGQRPRSQRSTSVQFSGTGCRLLPKPLYPDLVREKPLSKTHKIPGPVSIFDKTSYHKISLGIEAARLVVYIIVSR